MKYVLITGVSTGIGYDLSKAFLAKGYHVFGSVRKEADSERVAAELGENFTPLLFDVTDYEAIVKAVSKVSERAGNDGLAGLVNNAGIALTGPTQVLPLDVWRKQFEVNLFGAIAVTQNFLPLLGARPDCPYPRARFSTLVLSLVKWPCPTWGLTPLPSMRLRRGPMR